MTIHPVFPIDPGLVAEIAANMDLRTPNREALEAVAGAFDAADGEPFEVVCDLATAVGKTYLAGGILEYVAAQGGRNFLIVTPGRTILSKTINNFTAGHTKSVLGGMEARPMVITGDNFNTGEVAAALEDNSTVKLFVFSVQSLIRPKDTTRRKTRTSQEWLGQDLYSYLQGATDLVVLSDEHHVYAEQAKAFSEAIRDLDAMALIGLTATPAKTDLNKVIYHYPLARAIAERFVKTPVLVGRKDTRTDVEIRLRDGVELLRAKKQAADAYAAATGQKTVNPVMFVVCSTIEDANEVAHVLRKPGMYADNYDDAVLVIHSQAPDDALARLEAVEDPDSPVRVIVSVSMLKEGWDVKNIFVICSLRPSISDVLTEQTLGRGLRLPWGAYTGIELLDTVEVLSHERFETLLKRSGALLEGLVEARAAATPVEVPSAGSGGSAPSPPNGATTGTPAAVVGIPGAPEAAKIGITDPQHAAEVEAAGIADVSTILIQATEDRIEDAEKAAEQLQESIAPRTDVTVRIPKVTKTLTARSFSLSDVPDDEFTALGKRFAAEGGVALERKILDVIPDPNAPGGLRIEPRAGEVIEASAPEIPSQGVLEFIRDTILGRPYVDSSKANINASRRLAQAVIDGAGDANKLGSHLNALATAAALTVDRHYKTAPPQYATNISADVYGPVRVNSRPVELNRFGPFDRKTAYGGYTKGLHAVNWYDSEPERALANILEDDPEVTVWARIQRGELTIVTDAGNYSPDFYALRGGTHHLLEMKGADRVQNDEVQAKRKAAEDWARYVTDNGDSGTWQYTLIPDSTLKTAKTLPDILQQAKA